jgi:nucleotide-binding universal stress UspA family protein
MDNTNNQTKKGNIERILVPTDFSDYSLNACFFALHLSARTDAEILLFHVFFNPMVDAMAFPDAFTYQSNMADIFKDLEQNAKKEMKKFSKKIKRYAGLKNLKEIKIKTEVKAGQPGEEIDSIIKSFHPGIIVIGTKGHGEQSGEILGSVAARVIDTAGIPVLLVTRDARLKEKGEIKLLYATDFDESDYQSLDSLTNILSGYTVKIECVHFSTGSNSKNNRGKMAEMKTHFLKTHKKLSLDAILLKAGIFLKGLIIS